MTLNEVEDRLYAIMGHAYGVNSGVRYSSLYKDLAQFHEEVKAANNAAADRLTDEEMTKWETQRQQSRPSSAPTAGRP